jgi:hypothetical protein
MNLRRLLAGLLIVAPLGLCSCFGNKNEEGGNNAPQGGNNGSQGGGILPQGGQVRMPTFKFVKKNEGGCGIDHVFFYKGTDDMREVVWISADKKKFDLLAKGTKTFDIAKTSEELNVKLDLWDKTPKYRAYCNDISNVDAQRESTWTAKKGKITITIHEDVAEPTKHRNYKASAKLEGVVFDDGAGHEATLKEETITEVMVGWLAG